MSSPQFGYLLALRVTGQNNLLVSLPRMVERGTELVFEVALQRPARSAIPRARSDGAGRPGPQQDPPDETLLLTPEPRFLYSNRVFWYPQAAVSDYATATMRLTVPSEYQVVASGSLVNSSIAAATG